MARNQAGRGEWKSPAERYQDYVQAYADRVVAMLEAGTAPWIKPWRAGFIQPGAGMPYNAITGKGYSGSNAMMLLMMQQLQGFEDCRWLTFNQGMSMGAHLTKGSKGVQCVKWVEPPQKDEKTEEDQEKAKKRLVPVHRLQRLAIRRPGASARAQAAQGA